MPDPQLPEDDPSLSKRERQKQRRQRKLAEEAAAAKQAQTRRAVASFLVVALVLGAVGVWGANWWFDRQAQQTAIADARENLEALGCTEVEEQPILPSTHLSGDELAANPPEALYLDRPTTSGRHLGGVMVSGFFDKVVDERLTVHNLEHGYVHITFAEDADPEDVADIEAFVAEQIDGRTEKIIATRWKADLPGDARFAFTAWGARQTCEQWDRGVALGFLADYHYLEGTAPERTIQPHRGAPGELNPDEEEGDVLFPPLAEAGQVDVEDAMEQPEGSEEEPEPVEDAPLPADPDAVQEETEGDAVGEDS